MGIGHRSSLLEIGRYWAQIFSVGDRWVLSTDLNKEAEKIEIFGMCVPQCLSSVRESVHHMI